MLLFNYFPTHILITIFKIFSHTNIGTVNRTELQNIMSCYSLHRPSSPTPAKAHSFPRTAFFWHLVHFEVHGDFPFSNTQHSEGHRGQATSIPTRFLTVHPEQSYHQLLRPSCYSLTSVSQIRATFLFLLFSTRKTKQKDELERRQSYSSSSLNSKYYSLRPGAQVRKKMQWNFTSWSQKLLLAQELPHWVKNHVSAQLCKQGLQGEMKETIHVSNFTAVYIMQNWKGLGGFILDEV